MALEAYPVVHIQEPEQAVEQASVALENEADGVYLIDHGNLSPEVLLATFRQSQAEYPDQFIGVNILYLPDAHSALSILKKAKEEGEIEDYPDGLWVDDVVPKAKATEKMRSADEELRNIRYLGGVAFKMTNSYTPDPEEAAAQAERWAPSVDVVTTSGKRTGSAPVAEKVQAIKKAIGDKPLAIASGVDLENLTGYSAWVDQILFASSVEADTNSGVFDESKLAALISLAHEL